MRGGQAPWTVAPPRRLAALTVVAAGVLAVALHLDRDAATAADLATASTAPPAAVGAAPAGASAGARTALERGLARPAPSAIPAAGGTPVDESEPHRHVVDPRTGGLISLAGAERTFPDAAHLGPLHEDPLPPDAGPDDPTDTASLLARAGDVAAARTDDRPFAAAATAPIGTPTIATLSEHVAPSCSGTGLDRNRVQPLYVHEGGTPSRFTDVLPILPVPESARYVQPSRAGCSRAPPRSRCSKRRASSAASRSLVT